MASSSAPRSAYAAPRNDDDIEKGAMMNEFADAIVRRGFVRKVFGLLAVQLLVTVSIGAAIFSSPALKVFCLTSAIPVLGSLLLSFVPLIYMSVSEKARQEYPTNLMLMGCFTIGEGTLVGIATANYNTDIVLLALGITSVVTAALTVYALTTKTDFTGIGPYMYICLLTLITAGFVGMFVRTPLMNLGIGMAGAAIFGVYIVYDVQILMGGHHKFRLSPDEYVFAAINIYLDIINLFLYILRILNSRDN
ncbi:hypothetical protein FOA52_005461 [Chlamydomonas sp. UWO 241]|nr:hypothetical protein FOA52_005461 [Chlamydomonas sp. UWO 241]